MKIVDACLLLGYANRGCCLLGCGPESDLGRVYLSGELLLDGSPLEIGRIRVVRQRGTSGPVTIERFENGWYRTETKGGVPVGKHRRTVGVPNPMVGKLLLNTLWFDACPREGVSQEEYSRRTSVGQPGRHGRDGGPMAVIHRHPLE